VRVEVSRLMDYPYGSLGVNYNCITDFQNNGLSALAVKLSRLVDYPFGSLDVNYNCMTDLQKKGSQRPAVEVSRLMAFDGDLRCWWGRRGSRDCEGSRFCCGLALCFWLLIVENEV